MIHLQIKGEGSKTRDFPGHICLEMNSINVLLFIYYEVYIYMM